MRVVLQRVRRAEVRIGGRAVGAVQRGFLILVGFNVEDADDAEGAEARLQWMAEKIIGLRIFGDSDDKMNLSLEDVDGGLLVVSQFTLYGDARKGRRPSFIEAAPPSVAIPLYNRFVSILREQAPGSVETGEFGAMMDVELVNDGPVTLILER